jgi:hypothetical protein
MWPVTREKLSARRWVWERRADVPNSQSGNHRRDYPESPRHAGFFVLRFTVTRHAVALEKGPVAWYTILRVVARLREQEVGVHYGYLLIAVALEVCGTLLLPVSQNFTRAAPTAGLIVCYAAAFYCLTFALNVLPVAVVYATWSAPRW